MDVESWAGFLCPGVELNLLMGLFLKLFFFSDGPFGDIYEFEVSYPFPSFEILWFSCFDHMWQESFTPSLRPAAACGLSLQ